MVEPVPSVVPVDGAEGVPCAVDALVSACRAVLDRVEPADLANEVESGAVVVDIRPVEQRVRDGELPGALVIDRNVLEWRLDPTSPSRIALDDLPSRRVIIVCSEGYQSSLAASTLQQLGLPMATDLVGGYLGWRAHLSPSAAASPRDNER